MTIESETLAEPLAAAIGVLWAETVRAGKTIEALQKFETGLRALRILVGNCNSPFAGVALCNHIASVKQMINQIP